MSDFARQIERPAVEAAKQQVTQQVKSLRCRTHGKTATVRFASGTTLRDLKRGMTIQNICCEEFKAVVLKTLAS